MAVFTKEFLTQSVNGRAITVTATTAAPNLIHTTQSLSTVTDEIWLYAANISNQDTYLTLYWGSSASSDIIFITNIEAYAGSILIIPGLILRGDGSIGSQIFATATIASAIDVLGYINRIT
jgi:hypothetical protein